MTRMLLQFIFSFVLNVPFCFSWYIILYLTMQILEHTVSIIVNAKKTRIIISSLKYVFFFVICNVLILKICPFLIRSTTTFSKIKVKFIFITNLRHLISYLYFYAEGIRLMKMEIFYIVLFFSYHQVKFCCLVFGGFFFFWGVLFRLFKL